MSGKVATAITYADSRLIIAAKDLLITLEEVAEGASKGSRHARQNREVGRQGLANTKGEA